MRWVFGILLLVLLFGCLSQTTNENKLGSKSLDNLSGNKTQIIEQQNETTERVVPSNHSDSAVNKYDVLTADTTFPEIPEYNFSNITTMDGKLIIYYFDSPYCQAAIRLRPQMDQLKRQYGPDNSSIVWMEFDVSKLEGYLAYGEFAREKGTNPLLVVTPTALANGTIMAGIEQINGSLERILDTYKSPGEGKGQ
ncbi:hypothetical protein HY988_02355 [Candidatus Micrarchaeota archaeon]|nr:hypothetical protein [Candidatus Micrarchaeota archaeon]